MKMVTKIALEEICHKYVHVLPKQHQGAKKIIFPACHLGKLKLAFTSPHVISTSPKNFLTSRIDFIVLLLFEFLIKHHLPVEQVKNRIHWQGSKLRLIQSPMRLTFSPWRLKILVQSPKWRPDFSIFQTLIKRVKLTQTFHIILLCFHHKKCAKSHK